ncbi:MAG: T9SS type A sorting domain-containing protein [Chitinophagales bacterium]|nr:T9SS type A sorting domain-containing protein [Chitinophagales bacterium]
MKHLLPCLVLLLSAWGLSAQSLSPSVTATASGEIRGNNTILNWTLGESAISTIQYKNGILTEGFHQPILKAVPIEVSELPKELQSLHSMQADFQMLAAPNPVLSTLRVELKSSRQEEGQLQLFSTSYQLLSQQTVLLSHSSLDVEMGHLAAGTYYLLVRDQDGQILEAIKIIKAH